MVRGQNELYGSIWINREYLFALGIHELAKVIQEEIFWCLLFIYDIVLVDETRSGVNAKLEIRGDIKT